MYKLSPRRSHRSKGFKVKHTLQICLLLAVCFWLLYQVKRSHDKRKEFDTEDETVVNKVQTDGGIQRLGRKDLPRLMDEEKVAEDEANKLEEDELEKEGSRIKDTEEEDEIDENDLEKLDNEDELEKSEADDKHKKEHVDEDTEKEKNDATTQENHTEEDDSEEEEHSESEDNKDTVNNDAALEDQNRDRGGVSTNTQEAREEQYKADDASSEVAHNIQSTLPETENSTSGRANNIWGEVKLEPGNGTKTSNQVDKATNNRASSNITAEIKSTNSIDNSLQMSTLPAPPNNQTENSGNSSMLLPFNGTRALSDEKPNLLENLLEHDNKSKQAADGYSQSGATPGSITTENVNTVGESKVSGNMTSASSHNLSGFDTSLADDAKSENDIAEGENTAQHDLIDASDATHVQEEEEPSRNMVHMDTLPLPEIRNEVRNSFNRTTTG